ncbi:MAG: tetratricopeptide repeat protein [candidate division KSB1 bacterium]|nr:tetratricopeptide repeat protein [candidate division KSB1 bacterium]MDZ7276015.1 tetratricopeptide repeat protein [candidate division KSB1 bacterium]MDZ7285703.1 tetratricopeptide repeat protein [candidate division KSB1 bacterium]MDZ7298735.1 tetratricopeptide repeat protein [candidate division KSB1 bacterium]MDZ7305918.1 tetratricopeptide repeat protein [candidate division KSB1 bacterium]
MRQRVLRRTISPAALVLLAASVLVLLTACGGGRKAAQTEGTSGEEVDIDRLLEGGEQGAPPATTEDENEVLRLLGIVPEAKKPEAAASKPDTTAPVAMVQPETSSEVSRLQRELQEKNQQISSLQAEVNEKERRLQALQAELEAAQKRSSGNSRAVTVSGNYAQRYAQARELYEQKLYHQAIQLFAELLAEDDKNSLADNAQYWIGECYYGLGNYVQAVAEFQKLLAFSRSDKLDDAHLKLGLCYLRLGDRARARSELEQLLAIYPNSEYVAKARRYLSQM